MTCTQRLKKPGESGLNGKQRSNATEELAARAPNATDQSVRLVPVLACCACQECSLRPRLPRMCTSCMPCAHMLATVCRPAFEAWHECSTRQIGRSWFDVHHRAFVPFYKALVDVAACRLRCSELPAPSFRAANVRLCNHNCIHNMNVFADTAFSKCTFALTELSSTPSVRTLIGSVSANCNPARQTAASTQLVSQSSVTAIDV